MIGHDPVGYGYATEDEYITVTVQQCPCGNLVLEEYKAKRIDYKMASWILRQKPIVEQRGVK